MTYPVLRLSHVASTKTSNVDKKSYDGEVTVRLCNYTDVYKNDIITSDMDFMVATATPDQVGKFALKVGDTVFTKDSETADDIGIPAYVGESAYDLICGYHLAIARPLERAADPRFLYWCLASPEAAQQWSILASGVTRVGLRQADIGKLEIPVPPLQTQREVAAFLDRETAQIDDLIGKEERLIGMLAEKRQSIITKAVTKGLDRTAATKPSGIQWLETIPSHWRSSRMSYEVWVRARLGWKGLKAEEYVEDGIAFLSTPNIKGRRIDLQDVNRITPLRFEESPEIKLSVGDVVLAKDGSTLGTVNVVRDLPEPITVNSSIAVLTPSPSLNGVYLYYLLQADFLSNTIQLLKGGMGVPHLFQDDIKRFGLPIPPVAEQEAIATHLDEKIEELDTIITKVQSAVELLHERRAALISAALTGKIKVDG